MTNTQNVAQSRPNTAAVPGSNRQQSPILPAGLGDEDVVGRWLTAKSTGRGRLSRTTLEQYRTEAERLFWYARQVGVPISSWTLDEFSAYVGFLQAPAPWAIRARGVRRGSPEWRPFVGPLSDRSAGQTQKIVTSMFDWLRDVGYLQLNPAAGLPTVGRTVAEKQMRFLSPDECQLMRAAIAARGGSSRQTQLLKARDQFLVDLFELTGARTMEAMRCMMRDVQPQQVPEDLRRQFSDAPMFQWMLRIERGKGGKSRVVPCTELALSFQLYRAAFNLSPIPNPSEKIPLVLSVRRSKWGDWRGIRSRTAIWNVIKGLCDETIKYADLTGIPLDESSRQRLEKGSTHWLRHTYAKGLSEAIQNGLDTRLALENMGHVDERTFHQYVDDEPLKRALSTYAARNNKA